MEPETAEHETPPVSAREHLKTTRQKPAAGNDIHPENTNMTFTHFPVPVAWVDRDFRELILQKGVTYGDTSTSNYVVVLSLLSPTTPACSVNFTLYKSYPTSMSRVHYSSLLVLASHAPVYMCTCTGHILPYRNIFGALARYPEWPSISCITSSRNQILLPERTVVLIAINLDIRDTLRCESWSSFMQSQSERDCKGVDVEKVRDPRLTNPSPCNRHDSGLLWSPVPSAWTQKREPKHFA